MIKKVVVAAAGQGTRMLKLTKNKSKHLINVNKKPFLYYLLSNLIFAGYKDFYFVVGYRADLFEDFFSQFKKEKKINNIKINLVNQYEILGPKEKIYGTACPIMCLKDIIKEDFVVLYGDNLYSPKDLKKIGSIDKFNFVTGIFSEHPEKYGVLRTEGEFLKEIVEKPEKFISNLINCGLYKFTPEIFDKVFKIKKSKRGEYELTDAINLLAKENKVKVIQIQDYWIDFGNPGDILKVAKFLKKKKIKII
ncbi:MAG: sugar phosphate nucleotidyltransferase [Minisyncoccia bacterium]